MLLAIKLNVSGMWMIGRLELNQKIELVIDQRLESSCKSLCSLVVPQLSTDQGIGS